MLGLLTRGKGVEPGLLQVFVQEFVPTQQEQELYDLVSDVLRGVGAQLRPVQADVPEARQARFATEPQDLREVPRRGNRSPEAVSTAPYLSNFAQQPRK